MIAVNELRIDNYILFKQLGKGKGKIGQMKPGDFGRVKCDDPENSEYHPIPLTTKWLERLGFKKTGSLGDVFIKEGVALCMNTAGFMFEWPADHWDDDQESNMRVIESVHQLQNLYFALIGEELNVM